MLSWGSVLIFVSVFFIPYNADAKHMKGPNDTTYMTYGSESCLTGARIHNGLGGWKKVDHPNQIDGWDSISTQLFEKLNRDQTDRETNFRHSASNNGQEFPEVYYQVVSRAKNLCIMFNADECHPRDEACTRPRPRTFVAEVRQSFGPLLLHGEPQMNIQVLSITRIQ